ncbi:MAG: anhydro-N-acetylmuramic acid kinase [Cardiobacteriaceae bacterium]|nr:anhydro-N-acetylmuramic acid kinase [Cardiobacteriaceae bacterium]
MQEVFNNLYIGVMSGTSLDGVDVAVCNFAEKWQIIAQESFDFPVQLRADILDIANNKALPISKIAQIDQELGEIYAQSINKTLTKNDISAKNIQAIGLHGQTVYHKIETNSRCSLQLGNPNIVAVQTQIPVVADFRRKDIAFGGQGAPLVPRFHQELYQHSNYSTTVVLNIGGIANISVIQQNQATIGYDISVGNLLLDYLAEKNLGEKFDRDGNFAKSGKIIPELLDSFLRDEFIVQKPPKSTGREYFNPAWLDEKLNKIKEIANIQDLAQDANIACTLVEMLSIVLQKELAPFPSGAVKVAGGGAKNKFLMERIRANLPDWQISDIEIDGYDNQFFEAFCFAWLAWQRMMGKDANLPTVTGAKQKCTLGGVYLPD